MLGTHSKAIIWGKVGAMIWMNYGIVIRVMELEYMIFV